MKKSAPNRRRHPADDAPLSATELKTARPAHGVDDVRQGESKSLITLRLDKDLIASLRAGGDGWQTRINELLRAAVGLRG